MGPLPNVDCKPGRRLQLEPLHMPNSPIQQVKEMQPHQPFSANAKGRISNSPLVGGTSTTPLPSSPLTISGPMRRQMSLPLHAEHTAALLGSSSLRGAYGTSPANTPTPTGFHPAWRTLHETEGAALSDDEFGSNLRRSSGLSTEYSGTSASQPSSTGSTHSYTHTPSHRHAHTHSNKGDGGGSGGSSNTHTSAANGLGFTVPTPTPGTPTALPTSIPPFVRSQSLPVDYRKLRAGGGPRAAAAAAARAHAVRTFFSIGEEGMGEGMGSSVRAREAARAGMEGFHDNFDLSPAAASSYENHFSNAAPSSTSSTSSNSSTSSSSGGMMMPPISPPSMSQGFTWQPHPTGNTASNAPSTSSSLRPATNVGPSGSPHGFASMPNSGAGPLPVRSPNATRTFGELLMRSPPMLGPEKHQHPARASGFFGSESSSVRAGKGEGGRSVHAAKESLTRSALNEPRPVLGPDGLPTKSPKFEGRTTSLTDGVRVGQAGHDTWQARPAMLEARPKPRSPARDSRTNADAQVDDASVASLQRRKRIAMVARLSSGVIDELSAEEDPNTRRQSSTLMTPPGTASTRAPKEPSSKQQTSQPTSLSSGSSTTSSSSSVSSAPKTDRQSRKNDKLLAKRLEEARGGKAQFAFGLWGPMPPRPNPSPTTNSDSSRSTFNNNAYEPSTTPTSMHSSLSSTMADALLPADQPTPPSSYADRASVSFAVAEESAMAGARGVARPPAPTITSSLSEGGAGESAPPPPPPRFASARSEDTGKRIAAHQVSVAAAATPHPNDGSQRNSPSGSSTHTKWCESVSSSTTASHRTNGYKTAADAGASITTTTTGAASPSTVCGASASTIAPVVVSPNISPSSTGACDTATCGDLVQWKKGEQLGRGTFGAVFMALNTKTAELFAVKQIPLVDGTKEEVVRLEREITLMKRLDHPNIVRYLGTARDNLNLCIFMEYVPGGSIASMLSKFGVFSEDLTRRMVFQICQGINYLHSMGIVHRDVKGANVLVTDSGIAKLADFGCSRELHGIQSASLEDSLRAVTGSVPWMAPEVIKQSAHNPYAADIWSVGATVIEMSTAKHPWPECQNQLATLFLVATCTKPPPFPSNLSKVAKDFLSRCLVLDEGSRATASELLHHSFLASEATEASAMSNNPSPKGASSPPPMARSVLGHRHDKDEDDGVMPEPVHVYVAPMSTPTSMEEGQPHMSSTGGRRRGSSGAVSGKLQSSRR